MRKTIFILVLCFTGCHKQAATPVAKTKCPAVSRLQICNDGWMMTKVSSEPIPDSVCADHDGTIAGWTATRIKEGKHWRIVFTPLGENPDDVKFENTADKVVASSGFDAETWSTAKEWNALATYQPPTTWNGIERLPPWIQASRLPRTAKKKERVKPEVNSEGQCVPGMRVNVNGFPYNCSDSRVWVEDTKAVEELTEIEKERKQLIWAMRSRVLTDEELKKVYEGGVNFMVPIGPGLHTFDLDFAEKSYDELLAQQFRLRAAQKECRDGVIIIPEYKIAEVPHQ